MPSRMDLPASALAFDRQRPKQAVRTAETKIVYLEVILRAQRRSVGFESFQSL